MFTQSHKFGPVNVFYLSAKRSVLISFFHLRLGLEIGLFPSAFPNTVLLAFLLFVLVYLILFDLVTNDIWLRAAL